MYTGKWNTRVYIATIHNNVNGMKFKNLNSSKSEQCKIKMIRMNNTWHVHI